MKKISAKILNRDLLWKFLANIANRDSLVLLLIILLSFLIGTISFFVFKKEAEKKEIEIKKELKFDKKIYQEVVEKWREREKIFKEIDSKNYLFPF